VAAGSNPRGWRWPPPFFTGNVRGANDRVSAAFIGMGRMGTGNLNAMRQPNLQVAAVCDVYQPALDDATAWEAGKAGKDVYVVKPVCVAVEEGAKWWRRPASTTAWCRPAALDHAVGVLQATWVAAGRSCGRLCGIAARPDRRRPRQVKSRDGYSLGIRPLE
jgi:hypothetical protein